MNIGVVIPTLNEAAWLRAAVDAVRARATHGGAGEIIVADCGSTDATREIATSLGAMVVDASSGAIGRGAALDAGAGRARSDVLLFLDADSIVPLGWDRAIRKTLDDPRVVGGAFEFALDGPGVALRVVEAVNRVRYRVWRRYYGDQGLFVRAEAFRAVGGFGSRRILESSDLCVRLRAIGRLALVRRPMLTSPRRFVAGGPWRVFAHDVRLWWRDLASLSTEPFAAAYWRENERRGTGDSTRRVEA
ncbi:MAG: glycosyltransferase [Planctomycetes bacterium]|nr:glycosyltransferase [Planctomycetota bacterium]MBI3848315.1 glycosyltransferase [Planctomycetota bacterium]